MISKSTGGETKHVPQFQEVLRETGFRPQREDPADHGEPQRKCSGEASENQCFFRFRVSNSDRILKPISRLIVSSSTIDKMFEMYTFFEYMTEICIFSKMGRKFTLFFEKKVRNLNLHFVRIYTH